MFDNIGSKIKMASQVICWVGIVSSVIGGIGAMLSGVFFGGLLLAILGSFVSWVGSFMTYGFGQMVENSDTMVGLLYEMKRSNAAGTQEQRRESAAGAHVPMQTSTSKLADYSAPVNAHTSGAWVCKHCQTRNINTALFCKDCGEYR